MKNFFMAFALCASVIFFCAGWGVDPPLSFGFRPSMGTRNIPGAVLIIRNKSKDFLNCRLKAYDPVKKFSVDESFSLGPQETKEFGALEVYHYFYKTTKVEITAEWYIRSRKPVIPDSYE